MAGDDLNWVGAAPLSSDDMERFRKDLILRRTVLWVPTGLILAMGLLFYFELPLSELESIATLLFAFFVGVFLGRVSGNQRYRQIRDALLDGMDVAPLLQQEGKGIASRVLGMPGGADILDVLMRPQEGGALSKERDKWGRVVYKTRGEDPRGPAEGSGADTIDSRMPRIDAMTPRPEFEGLEGELTEGEKLVEEANTARDLKSQESWEAAEKSDPELIEAGVEKLGDLVKKGHDFGEGGDFPRAPTRAEPNMPPPSSSEPDEDLSLD
ncbi:MAG: hypothetical protein ACJZ4J_03705 [Candidatus Poseidoniales archaeon]